MKKSIKYILIIAVLFITIFSAYKIISYKTAIKKQKEYSKIIEQYLVGVEKWKNDNMPIANKAIITKITLKDLLDGNYVEKNLKNPLTKKLFSEDLSFCIIKEDDKYSYKYDDGKECGDSFITYETIPEEAYNGYVYEQKIKVDFSSIAGLEYYIKSTINGVTDMNVYFACGKDSKPANCINIPTTRSIEAGKWYRVSGDIDILFDEQNDNEGIIYALTTDHVAYSNIIEGKVSKIDRTKPIVTLDTPVSTTNSISVKIIDIKDNETDIASSVCKYGTEENNYTTESMHNRNGKLSKCSINFKLKDKTYYYQVCATDMVGNTGCSEGNSLIKDIKLPTLTMEEIDERKIVNIAFNAGKKKNLTYYVKSTVEGITSQTTLSYCGIDVLPTNCTDNKVTNILPNAWYKVSGDLSVIYISKTSNDDILYALIYSDNEYGASATIELK